MDIHLYEAGRQLLLDRQDALRSAGQWQHLPQLNATASKPHKRHHSQFSLHDAKGKWPKTPKLAQEDMKCCFVQVLIVEHQTCFLWCSEQASLARQDLGHTHLAHVPKSVTSRCEHG